MDSSDIIEISQETLVDDAIQRAKEAYAALNALLLHKWTRERIASIGKALANQFDLNEEDLSEFLIEKISSELHTVTNPEALGAWLYRVGENHCKNEWKHSKVVKRHEEFVEHINSSGRRNSILVQTSGVSTPEDELMAKMEEPIWDARLAATRAAVRRIITEDVIIAQRWGAGSKPEDIANEIHKSVSTVYRRLGNMQKAVIEEIGIDEPEEDKSEFKEGLRELFANSLQRVSS